MVPLRHALPKNRSTQPRADNVSVAPLALNAADPPSVTLTPPIRMPTIRRLTEPLTSTVSV
jgi:hypothetical protein